MRTKWILPVAPTAPAQLIHVPVSCSETDSQALARHMRDHVSDRRAALVVFYDMADGDMVAA